VVQSQPYLKKKPQSQKRGGGLAKGLACEFKPQHCEKKKTKPSPATSGGRVKRVMITDQPRKM
jgi:hypothetical protein